MSASKVSYYEIGDSEENDTTNYFTNVTLVDGELTVEKLIINVALQNTTVYWNTGIQFPYAAVTYVNGDYVGYSLSLQGTQESGLVQTLSSGMHTGDTITVTVNGIDTTGDPDQYTISAPSVSVSGNSGNYTLTNSGGCTMTLKLDPSDTGSP